MNDSVLLPFDCVCDFLKEHPLMVLSKAQMSGVYDAIVAMLQHVRRHYTKEEKAQPTRESPVQTCALCKGVQLYDSHRGELVCNSCGACSRYTSKGDSNLFDKQSEERATCQQTDRMQSWVRKTVEFADGEYRRMMLEKEVDSWNNYHLGGPNHGLDTLRRLKMLVHVPERVGPIERVIGALLLPAIEHAFDLDKVADAVRNGKRLPTLQYEEPKPEFACIKCGAPVFNKYEERRHPCSWGKRKRQPVHMR